MDAKKPGKVPIIRESSSSGLIMLCVFERGSACPKNTIVLQQFGMAYIIKAKPNDSLVFSNVGCDPLFQALSRAYSLAFQASKEITEQEEFSILFEGKSGKKEKINSKEFHGFLRDYFKSEYSLSY